MVNGHVGQDVECRYYTLIARLDTPLPLPQSVAAQQAAAVQPDHYLDRAAVCVCGPPNAQPAHLVVQALESASVAKAATASHRALVWQGSARYRARGASASRSQPVASGGGDGVLRHYQEGTSTCCLHIR
jgi:hypothetical protein